MKLRQFNLFKNSLKNKERMFGKMKPARKKLFKKSCLINLWIAVLLFYKDVEKIWNVKWTDQILVSCWLKYVK